MPSVMVIEGEVRGHCNAIRVAGRWKTHLGAVRGFEKGGKWSIENRGGESECEGCVDPADEDEVEEVVEEAPVCEEGDVFKGVGCVWEGVSDSVCLSYEGSTMPSCFILEHRTVKEALTGRTSSRYR